MPGHPTTLAYSKARACCACSRCGMGGLFLCVFFSSRLSDFTISNASSPGDGWTRLKYCGLGHYNPTVLVSYYWRCAH